MALKYYNAQKAILKSPKEFYRDNFSEIFDANISNAPNYFDDIQVEKNYGLKDFKFTSARVDSVINPSTGYKYGDDYKSFVFSSKDDPTYVGR